MSSKEQKYVKTKDGTIIIFQEPIFHSKMRHIADIVSAGFICFGRVGMPQCKCYGRSESLDLDSDPKDTEIANKQLFGVYQTKQAPTTVQIRILIEENKEAFERTLKDDGDCIMHFDNGESCNWSQYTWPFALSTHFSRIPKPTKEQ